VSLKKGLLEVLDKHTFDRAFINWSQVEKQFIKSTAVTNQWQCNTRVPGLAILAPDHHRKALINKRTDLPCDYPNRFYASKHARPSHVHCMEIVAVNSKFADKLSRKWNSVWKTING
jgi:metal-responsive CopG/Arc/MetJ family transcriptional regulator